MFGGSSDYTRLETELQLNECVYRHYETEPTVSELRNELVTGKVPMILAHCALQILLSSRQQGMDYEESFATQCLER